MTKANHAYGIFTSHYDVNFDPSNRFGVWGDYDKTSGSTGPFYSRWDDGFCDAWCYGGYCGLRLCKAFEKGC